jgi:hypothetical protein
MLFLQLSSVDIFLPRFDSLFSHCNIQAGCHNYSYFPRMIADFLKLVANSPTVVYM